MPEIQYCEDCKNCIMPSLHPELNMTLSRCAVVRIKNTDYRISRSIEKPKNQFCGIIRKHDDCENYEEENINPEYDPTLQGEDEHFVEHEPQRSE